MTDHTAQRDDRRPSGSILLSVLAALLLGVSAFLLYTLVLEEPYLVHGWNDAVIVGVPAVAGVVVAVLAVLARRSRPLRG